MRAGHFLGDLWGNGTVLLSASVVVRTVSGCHSSWAGGLAQEKSSDPLSTALLSSGPGPVCYTLLGIFYANMRKTPTLACEGTRGFLQVSSLTASAGAFQLSP